MNALRGAIVVIIALVIGVVILARGLDEPETSGEPVQTTDTTAATTTVAPPPPAEATPPPPEAAPSAPAAAPPAAPAPDEIPPDLEPVGEDLIAPPPPAAAPTHNRSDVRVLVSNGSGVCGAAGALTASLSAQGFNVLSPVNDDLEGNIESSVIYYVEEYGADAGVVASLLQVDSSQVLAMPAVAPTAAGDAHVLIHLGEDDLAQPNC